MPDLHSLLVASLTARLERARAATPGPWNVLEVDGRSVETAEGEIVVAAVAARKLWPTAVDAAFIAGCDPATEIRRVEAALRVVERHAPDSDNGRCVFCVEWCDCTDGCITRDQEIEALDDCIHGNRDWPCPDIRDLAAGEGIEVGM